MEIDPGQRHNADLIGRLRQQYQSDQPILDALPAAQRQPIARGIQAASITDTRSAGWEHPAQGAPTWTTPEREAFAPVARLRRPVRHRRRLVWWERWLLAALRLTFRLERWWRRRHRKHRLHHQRQRARPR